ncbi:MAG TPA: DNA ligase D [Xanthobacteraceae bacterium]|nr:DNA ligase D [Xanthobacteraceae bacterium]
MGLQTYHAKRKFGVTSEPRGKIARRKGNQFVIQKHAARRLHYDLRLELDGVMKSWAVTRGPSLVPGEKRLAVQVEDHPIAYNTFEGTIPEGQYGAGTVMIWDRGTWEPDGDPHKGLAKGSLDFALQGEKLNGRWHLVRMRGRPGEKRDNWLLIKARDEGARDADDPDILQDAPDSVVSGRSIESIARGKSRVWQSNRAASGRPRTVAQARDGTSTRKPEAARSTRPRAAKSARAAKTARSAKQKRKAKGKTNTRGGNRTRGGKPLPDFVPPSLATLREQPPQGVGWVHEIKFDGYRIQAHIDDGEVRLLTRKGLDWTDKFPNIARALAGLPVTTALIDGELVVEDATGVSSFSALQAALKAGERARFVYYVFDLLHLDGDDLAGEPLSARKAALARLVGRVKPSGPIRYSEHFETSGAEVLARACEMALEGIVSKRADAPYRPGRSDSFIKAKCANAQEFVVGGYVPSTALPRAIGSLVLGYYDDGALVYAGRMGTGYTRATAQDLWTRLHAIEIAKPPFDRMPSTERRRDTHWARPELVIEAQFRGWTADGLVRQASFKGVREDKPAAEVVREVAVSRASSKSSSRSTSRSAASKAPAKSSARGRKRAAAHAARVAAKHSPAKAAKVAKAAKRPTPPRAKAWSDTDVRFTHPDRVYWVDAGVTKQDLADYYRDVWEWMAPQVVGRPLALVRCPEGTKGQCFFQKHASAGLTERNLRSVIDTNGRQIIAVEDLDGLLSLVQAGVLEVHVRGAMIDRLDLCDRIIFDLDPGEDLGWSDIVVAARDVHDRLGRIGLESFVKLSGGKGLHVVVPIAGTDWDTTKTFVQAFAFAMAADAPEHYIAKMTKSLRKGKIFIDYLRNSIEQTSVAAYSTRARAGAPVSAPVSWQELGRTTGSNQYTVLNLMQRLRGLNQDPWRDAARLRQTLPDLNTLRKRG